MTFTCRCCGARRAAPARVVHVPEMMFGHRTIHGYEVCGDCGCTGLAPEPSRHPAASEYGDSYYSVAGATAHRPSRLMRLRDRYYVADGGTGGRLLAKLRPNPRLEAFRRLHVKAEGSLLDVGAGSGRLLASLTAGRFQTLQGCEPLLRGPLLGEGFEVTPGGIEQLSNAGPWDVVLMNHSLEHMDRPGPVLRQVAEMLSRDGSLIVRIPVRDGLAPEIFRSRWYQFDAPRHRSLHRRQCIHRLAEDAGLTVTRSYDDSTWRQFELSLLYCANVSPGDPGLLRSRFVRTALMMCRPVFGALSVVLNRMRRGDQAVFLLRHRE